MGSLDVENILVLVATWMGSRVKQEMTAEDTQEILFMAWRVRDQHEWLSQADRICLCALVDAYRPSTALGKLIQSGNRMP